MAHKIAPKFARKSTKPVAIPIRPLRQEYEQHSVRGFYENFGAAYRNPHEGAIAKLVELSIDRWSLNCDRVLDLACGSGEVTLALRSLGYQNISGIDPYTYAAYRERTGNEAEPYSFEEIAEGVLGGRNYSLIICSFALHLIAISWLPRVIYQLSLITNSLVAITPNKNPNLKPEWGWMLLDEIALNRVRARLYQTES